MQCILYKIYFWKVFHKYYNLICIFICIPICTNFFILVKSGCYTRPGAAPGPPRFLRRQLPLPGPGQLRGRHVSCGLSSRCPARDSSGATTCPAASAPAAPVRGSSGAATCPAASAPAAQPGVALGPPRVLWPQLPLPSPGQLRGRHVCPGGPTVGVLLK